MESRILEPSICRNSRQLETKLISLTLKEHCIYTQDSRARRFFEPIFLSPEDSKNQYSTVVKYFLFSRVPVEVFLVSTVGPAVPFTRQMVIAALVLKNTWAETARSASVSMFSLSDNRFLHIRPNFARLKNKRTKSLFFLLFTYQNSQIQVHKYS